MEQIVKQGIAVLAAMLMTLALVGCETTGDDETAEQSVIYSFDVEGTDGRSTISPYQNGGIFTLYWDAESSTRPYRAEVYVSADNTLDPDDKMIIGRNCDQDFGDCRDPSAVFRCSFDSDNIVICPAGAVGGSATRTNLSEYFSQYGLPGNYRMILRVCDGLFTDCVGGVVPVTFN